MNTFMYNNVTHFAPLVTDTFIKSQGVAHVIIVDNVYASDLIRDQIVTLKGMIYHRSNHTAVDGHILFAQHRENAVVALFKTKRKELDLPALVNWLERDLVFFDSEVVVQAIAVITSATPDLLAPHTRALFNGLMKGQLYKKG